ncbi:MAG TPA: Flp pilus assembly protein CpaB [Pirellulales bacterium]|nr:Flp pilus assembly protein CpaB [Pirellulales bacterium]
MRPKSIILLGLALGCGLVATIGINQVMANRNQPAAGPVDGTEVFVALQDIAMGDPINKALLKLEKWPTDKLVDGMIFKLEDIEGRRSRQKIFAGEPILENKLLKKGETGASATDMIPPGYRAVPVSVDAVSGSSGMILPGDRVDLLVHIQGGMNQDIRSPTTVTFLQNVKVFAVDDNFSRAGDETTATAKTISVLVTPDQAQMVMLAASVGKVQMVMRSANDDAVETTGLVDVQTLLHGRTSGGSAPPPPAPATPTGDKLLSLLNQQKAPPLPEPARPAPRNVFTMVVIKGADMSKAEFADGKATNLPDQADATTPKAPPLPLLPPRPDAGPKPQGGDAKHPADGKDNKDKQPKDKGKTDQPGLLPIDPTSGGTQDEARAEKEDEN